MDNYTVARASVSINAAPSKVWNALLDLEAIKQYMFGAKIITDWITLISAPFPVCRTNRNSTIPSSSNYWGAEINVTSY